MPDRADDMTRGVYRRQYANFVGGRRLSALTLEAEAWFWRVHAAADDYGNLAGEPSMLYARTVGRRAGTVTIAQVVAWVDEMLGKDLVRAYLVDGERFLHVVGFAEMQPAGRNGRRVRRFPASPWDGGGDLALAAVGQSDAAGDSGIDAEMGDASGVEDSGCIPVNPNRPAPHHNHNHHQKSPPAPATPAAAAPAEPAAARGESGDGAWTFPCTGTPSAWALTGEQLATWRGEFAALNVEAELRAARVRLGVRGKRAGEMWAYLASWLQRSLTRPEMRAKPAARPRAGGGRRPATTSDKPTGAIGRAERAQQKALEALTHE